MIRTPKDSLRTALVSAANAIIALLQNAHWLNQLVADRDRQIASLNAALRSVISNTAANNCAHIGDIAKNDRRWLFDCTLVGLAGLVLGLLVGGVWL